MKDQVIIRKNEGDKPKKCFSDFLCNECFGIIATIFGTVIALLFLGIIFYSIGIPMRVFYIVVGIGFTTSLIISLIYMKKRRDRNRSINKDNNS